MATHTPTRHRPRGRLGHYPTENGQPELVLVSGGAFGVFGIIHRLSTPWPEDRDVDVRWVEDEGVPISEAQAIVADYLDQVEHRGGPLVIADR